MEMKQPKAPAELGAEGKRLWRQIAADAADQGIELTSQELVWLRQAGKLADTIALMEAALEGAELIVKGYNGQPVSNPLLSELRMHRQLLAQTVDACRPTAPPVCLRRGRLAQDVCARRARSVERVRALMKVVVRPNIHPVNAGVVDPARE